jgi:hypothetical protein
MKYRMQYLGRKNGREHWRGTGWCQKPGGITYVNAYFNAFWHEFKFPWILRHIWPHS